MPTTVITRTPTGGGVSYEPINLISPRQRAGFLADGTSRVYVLPYAGLDGVDSVTVDGAALTSGWTADCAAMTILMDQHTGKGAKLEFLGRPARTFTSASRLAMRSGLPIVVGSFVRVAPYRYRLVGGTPLTFGKTDDLLACTQALNDRLGEAIRRYPEQYLWFHRRWRDD